MRLNFDVNELTQGRFNPRTPCGVRHTQEIHEHVSIQFQSTHSLRSATALADLNMIHMWVSIHALLAECDTICRFCIICIMRFNPRTPCGVRLSPGGTWRNSLKVSIHALLAECDHLHLHFPTLYIVSIHALLAECDKQFMTTQHFSTCFNPRTPCGVRPGGHIYTYIESVVSIHALLAECDFVKIWDCPSMTRFQSTHSLRSATIQLKKLFDNTLVSIHALLAECDV